MDLKKLDLSPSASKGSTLRVLHPVTDEELVDEKGRAVTITVLGNQSREFRRKVDEINRRDQRKRRPAQLSLAESDRRVSELLAAVTKSWEHVEWEGVPLECTEENAAMLYRELPWLRAAVDEYIGEVGNFFKKS